MDTSDARGHRRASSRSSPSSTHPPGRHLRRRPHRSCRTTRCTTAANSSAASSPRAPKPPATQRVSSASNTKRHPTTPRSAPTTPACTPPSRSTRDYDTDTSDGDVEAALRDAPVTVDADLHHPARTQQSDGTPRHHCHLGRRAATGPADAVRLDPGCARRPADAGDDVRTRRRADPGRRQVRRRRLRLQGRAALAQRARRHGGAARRRTAGEAGTHPAADVRRRRLSHSDHPAHPTRRRARRHADRHQPRGRRADRDDQGVRRADRRPVAHAVRRAPPARHPTDSRNSMSPCRSGCARPASAPACSPSRSRWTNSPSPADVDPIELRIRNEPDVDPETGNPWSDRRLVECLRTGAERFGWADRDPTPRRSSRRRVAGRHRRRLGGVSRDGHARQQRPHRTRRTRTLRRADRRGRHRHRHLDRADADRRRHAGLRRGRDRPPDRRHRPAARVGRGRLVGHQFLGRRHSRCGAGLPARARRRSRASEPRPPPRHRRTRTQRTTRCTRSVPISSRPACSRYTGEIHVSRMLGVFSSVG